MKKKTNAKTTTKQTKKLGTEAVTQKKRGAVKTGVKAGYTKW